MTKQEKIVVSAYTGVMMCDFKDLHAYIEKKLGRPVFTHELRSNEIQLEIQEKTKEDFMDICRKETMTPNDYQRLARRTASEKAMKDPILNGVLGLGGESGEAEDLVKKERFQDHELDKAQMAKELGDVAWYLAFTAYGIGYDLEDIFRMNIEKLKARYPNGFDAEHSLHRKPGDI